MLFNVYVFKKRARKAGFTKRGISLKSNRRNGFDITRDILKVCLNDANKTHIVYAANLNNKRINSYLEICLQMKLLTKKFRGGNFVYHTTLDGVKFLRSYFGALHEQKFAADQVT